MQDRWPGYLKHVEQLETLRLWKQNEELSVTYCYEQSWAFIKKNYSLSGGSRHSVSFDELHKYLINKTELEKLIWILYGIT